MQETIAQTSSDLDTIVHLFCDSKGVAVFDIWTFVSNSEDILAIAVNKEQGARSRRER